MVRINLITPKNLADQHLIAEYDEILMLVAYIKKYPKIENIPDAYCLGMGHMKFFKDKLLYIKNRHENIKSEMKKRGFKINKTINLDLYNKENIKDWKPNKSDLDIIKKRIISKIELNPDYYRYYGIHKNNKFLINLIKK
jgi:deoxyribonuclease (pyrimidine dimer)